MNNRQVLDSHLTPVTTPEISWERVGCNLCGADNARLYHRETLPYFDRPLTFDIVKCRKCGLVYTNPRLVDYNATYLSGVDRQDEHFADHDRAKHPVFASALDQIRRLTPSTSTDVRILDIGCGSGYFLHLARQRGWQVQGIEPAETSARYAAGHYHLPVERADMYTLDWPEAQFDVITAWDVIEHVPDPAAFLQQCSEWLKPGGLLALRFPGDRWQKIKGILFHHLLQSRRAAFGATMHLYFFNETTMGRLAARAGLTMVYSRTTPSEINSSNPVFNRLKTLSYQIIRALELVGGRTVGNLEVYCQKQK